MLLGGTTLSRTLANKYTTFKFRGRVICNDNQKIFINFQQVKTTKSARIEIDNNYFCLHFISRTSFISCDFVGKF